MRVIIAGSRGVRDKKWLLKALSAAKLEGIRPSVVLSGCAQGADTLGEQWARRNNVPVEEYPAFWHVHGRAAGPIRNRQMAMVADALIALWDGSSRGTENMVYEARRRGLKVYVQVCN